MAVKPEFLKNTIFSDDPANWFVHAQGFYYAGIKLIEANQKLEKPKKFISTKEVFNKQYTYKIAIYLLSHAIELLLKSLISIYNKINPSNPLKPSAKYGHNITKMVDGLLKVGAITLDAEEKKTLEMVGEYLKWFGRYYCPQAKDVAETIKQTYTEPDKKGLIEFKYKLKCPETHLALDKIYRELSPKENEAALTVPYLLHCP